MSEHNPPDRRKHGYRELEEQVNAHTAEIEDRLRRFFIKALTVFAILGFTSAGSLLGFGIVLRKQAHSAAQIQEQRFNSFLQICHETNNRHDHVIATIEKVISDIPPGPKRIRAKKGAEPFTLILSAAVPYTADCYAYARSRVQGF
jgi:hypothetical protein